MQKQKNTSWFYNIKNDITFHMNLLQFQQIFSQQLEDTTEIEYSISSSTSIGVGGINQENTENSLTSTDTTSSSINPSIEFNHTREALSHEASEHESVS